MHATAKKNVRIPVDRIDEVLEYLSLVAPEQAEEVLNMIAERVGKERNRAPVQLTLIKNEEITPTEPTGQLNVVENPTPQAVEELKTELAENREELETVQEKLEQVKTLITSFKEKAHPTSPRWQHARALLAELEKLINTESTSLPPPNKPD
ncbi:hypothetical protein BegalDRAFT_0942 [Beggiatoa alba B18LD]|uniref:Uncharacterized protein n=1 Tax=Beggiatoa alba B18LD TaxID=395493 RepID=I3CE06_9GAMM|nr:hypothetical protein [Beggiatoa alba]EIJ41849.1 hypothetical protein BegalDRAFT_0942 [Beggiatoa alba B18LD]